MSAPNFSDCNALAYQEGVVGDRVTQGSHLGKRKRKNKALEIVFDPAGHKEFVTGFHKRKLERKADQQRRKKGQERKKQLQAKAERKAALRERLDLARYETDSEEELGRRKGQEEEGGAEPKRQKTVFETAKYRTVVTVAPISMHDDSDAAQEEEEGQEEEQEGGEPEGEASAGQQGKQAGEGRASQPGSRPAPSRGKQHLSKSSSSRQDRQQRSSPGQLPGSQLSLKSGSSRKAAGTFSRLVLPDREHQRPNTDKKVKKAKRPDARKKSGKGNKKKGKKDGRR